MRVAACILILVAAGCLAPLDARVLPEHYLKAEPYTKWVVEVDYASTERPTAGLLDFASSRLNAVAHKQSIEFRLNESLPSGDMAGRTWTDEDLIAYADAHRDIPTTGDTVVTHLLFLAGQSEHGRVLGVAIGYDLIVMFSESIKDACDAPLPIGGLCTPDPYFRAVLLHEFGHVLGLVDNGTPMVRNHEAETCGDAPNERPDEGHSRNRNSVMYCQVETSFISSIFGRNPPTEFDADDRADLKAAGGK